MRLVTLLLLTILCTCVCAQTGEFTQHANGYIYPEATMNDLAYIVDSLDLKFKQCDLDREYCSPAQTMATCYEVKNKNLTTIARQLRKAAGNEPFSLLKVLPDAKQLRRGILYQTDGTERAPGITWNLMPLNFGDNIFVQPDEDEVEKVTELIYVAKAYNSTRIWVLDHLPVANTIPEETARLIQYVDCMVDTTENIFRPESTRATGGYLDDGEANDAGKHFMKLANRYPGKKPKNIWEQKNDPTDEEYEQYAKETKAYNDGQLAWVKEQVASNPKMAASLKKLIDEVKAGNTVGARAEQYLEICGEYAAALESKRLRRVYGSCSMDSSPRYHAMDIARLSAASVEWSVFLRAHLNIINDRFDRMSDGSYAQAGRGTYFAELEALGIDAAGLLIGSCLYAENMADNHYSGSWNRVGRALTEAADTDAVIARLTGIIRDENLDPLNRMTGVYLLRFMASNYGKLETDERYTRALATAVAGLDAEWAKLVEVE